MQAAAVSMTSSGSAHLHGPEGDVPVLQLRMGLQSLAEELLWGQRCVQFIHLLRHTLLLSGGGHVGRADSVPDVSLQQSDDGWQSVGAKPQRAAIDPSKMKISQVKYSLSYSH